MPEPSRRFIDPFEMEVAAAAENLKNLGAVNLATIFLALANDSEKFHDKENIKTLIYMRRPLSVFEMPATEYGAFRRDAENFRIINSAIMDERSPDTISVIIMTEDKPRVKQIFDAASYDTSNIILEEQPKNSNARPRHGNPSVGRGRTSTPSAATTMTNSVRSAIRGFREAIELERQSKNMQPQQSWHDLIGGG